MIDAATSADLARIAACERDVLGAYVPGFVPEASNAARPLRAVPAPDPLSVAAPQGAYFVNANASGPPVFSRAGGFGIVEGELRTADGRPVLGFALGDRKALVPLRVDPYDLALGRVSDPGVAADGSFGYARSAIDPRTGERRTERVIVGRLALARFPAGTQPVRIDAIHVTPPAGVRALVGVPSDGNFAPLLPRARDLGGVDIVAGLEKMREAYEAFDALRTAHQARGTIEKATLDLVK